MTTPNWRQLARIPESSLKAEIIKALGVEVPPEGISDIFHDGPLYASYHSEGIDCWLCYGADDAPLASRLFSDGSALLKAVNVPASTPRGGLLRQWMRRWGWVPKNERPIEEPNRNTRTVT